VSATMAAVKGSAAAAVGEEAVVPRAPPLPPVQFCCLGSRRIKRAWRVTPREMMTGGVGDGIAIGFRPRRLRR